MSRLQINLHDSLETEAMGAALWQFLPKKCLVFLSGDLGAGKTTLIRGLLKAAGYQHAVKSPTYSLVEEYELADNGMLFHFDLYRLKDPEELEWMGMQDYLQASALCCIEWPQMGKGFLPDADIEIQLSMQGTGRKMEIDVINADLKNNLHLNWKNKDLLL